jgi:hypothetical protein
MNKFVSGAIMMAVVAAAAAPSWAQTNPRQTGAQMQSGQPIAPGTGGVSKPDMRGLPDTQSGPAVTPSGTTLPDPSQLKESGDESHIQGLPDTESGPAVKPSNMGR